MKNTAAAKPIRVVLADDHDLVRSGIKALLSMVDGVEVIAEARDGTELISLVDSLKPDVVMTDISMPGMDGITAISEIHAQASRRCGCWCSRCTTRWTSSSAPSPTAPAAT